MSMAEQNQATNPPQERQTYQRATPAQLTRQFQLIREGAPTSVGYFLPRSLFWPLPVLSSGTIFPASNPPTMRRWTSIFTRSALAFPDISRRSTLKTTNGSKKVPHSWKSIPKTMKSHWQEPRQRSILQRPPRKVRISMCPYLPSIPQAN